MNRATQLTLRALAFGFACSSLLSACMSAGLENAPRTSLFGAGRPQRQLPPSTAGATANSMSPSPRSGINAQQMPVIGSVMPQLNSALSGNISGGLAQPMVNSPLLFQRLDRNTWRVATTAGHLFQTIARVISQSYIISQADRRALSLSTEWDKFFIDGRLFRNRISVNVFPYSARSADLIIKNNIEYYTQTAQKTDENNPTQWLPTQDVTDELDRVLEKTQSQLMAQLPATPAR
jgi:hypothetical protein